MVKLARIEQAAKRSYGTIVFNGFTFSLGNAKLGNCLNVGFNNDTCPADAPCRKLCYAARLCKIRPSVATCYDRNTATLFSENGIADFAIALDMAFSYCEIVGIGFRMNEDGDIANALVLDALVRACRKHPAVTVLSMTKQYRIINDYIAANGGSRETAFPANLKIAFSEWPNYEMHNPYNMPVRGFTPKGEQRKSGRNACPSQSAKMLGYVWQCSDCIKHNAGCAANWDLDFCQH